MVNISAKFDDNISNGFQVTGRTRFYDRNHYFSVQRAITPKVGLLCSACHLLVVNISIKFCKNISNGFQVIGRTQFCNRQTDVHGKNNVSDPEVGKYNISCILSSRCINLHYILYK